MYSSELKYFKDLEGRSKITADTFQVFRLFCFVYMITWVFCTFVVASRHYSYFVLLKRTFVMLQRENAPLGTKFVLCFGQIGYRAKAEFVKAHGLNASVCRSNLTL
jgi:hypothetical protein